MRLGGCAGALCSLMLAACGTLPASSCRPGEQAAIHDSLFLGTGKPTGGSVTADEWDGFLAATVTPRFPQGLSVAAASGQWRGNDGAIVKEATHVLLLIHPDEPAAEAAVQEIANAYKQRFAQEAVLRVKARVCMSI